MTATAEPATGHIGGGGLDLETLNLMLEALTDFVSAGMDDEKMLELDHEDVCPEDLVRAMQSDELGVQLVFLPEAYGGMGGGAFDIYRVCERMGRIDIGLATSVLATSSVRTRCWSAPPRSRGRSGWARSPRRASSSRTARPSRRRAATWGH
jgi:alkylation response protein AidB-like acyl-CoA dehydrogenase